MRHDKARKMKNARRVMTAAAQGVAHLRTRWPGDPDRKIAVVRLLILFALLPLMWWDLVSPETKQVLIGLTALIAVYILAALFVFPRLRRTVLRHDLFLTIDILAVTALVWFTGGIRSSLLFLFYLPVLAAAIRLDLREAILSAAAVSGVVIWMWNVAEGGLPSLGSTTLRVGLFTGSSVVLAVIFGIMAQESRLLQARAQRNRELNERLTEATEQLRRRLSELEFAYDLSRRLAGVTDTPTVLMTVTEAAQELLQAPYGAVFLADHVAGGFHPAYAAGISDREAMSLVHACADQVTPQTTDPLTLEVDDAPTWLRAVCAPIVVAGRLLGVLCAGGDDQWHPARHSGAVLGHVASQAGIALDRTSLLEDLQRLALAKPEARLFTREQLNQILPEEIARATRLGVPVALLKLVLTDIGNATYPRAAAAADLIHKQAAEVVLSTARRADVVAQGELGELFVMLAMSNLTGARKFLSRLLDELKKDAALSRLLGSPSGPNLRAGIAVFPDDAVAAAELTYAAQNAAEAATPEQPVACAGDLEPRHATT